MSMMLVNVGSLSDVTNDPDNHAAEKLIQRACDASQRSEDLDQKCCSGHTYR